MNKQLKNILAGVTQLIIIAAFIGVIYFMFNQENIVLNPVPYTLIVGAVMLLIDYIILNKIFKEDNSQSLDSLNVEQGE